MSKINTQSIPDSTPTEAVWGSQDDNSWNMWANTATTHIVIPIAGLYAIGANLQWQGGTGLKVVGIRINGIMQACNEIAPGAVGGDIFNNNSVEITTRCAANDVITIIAEQNTGSALLIQPTATGTSAGCYNEVNFLAP
jgi:hypothetical protein